MNTENIAESVHTLHDLPTPTSHNPICPILVGIAGGSGSGKTTLCNTIVKEIGEKNCLVISLDSFYKPLTEEQAIGFNFDHPDAYDFDLCYDVIKKLLQRQPAQIPIYNFVKNTREEESLTVHACELILFEGILALYNPKLVALMNLKLFVDCDNDIRLYRRVLRDVKERGRDVGGILFQYNKFVKPAFDELIRPTMHHANLIIPGRSDNRVATRFIVQNLRLQLARLQEVKSDMNNNAYYADVLDSCWLNVQKGEDAEDTDDLSLYQSERILLIRDGSEKTDCLQIFNLFNNKFTDSLYMTLMIRFLNYGIKMMLQNVLKKATGCKMVYFQDIVHEDIKDLAPNNAVGIIVPFLYEETLTKVHEKVEKLLEKEPTLKIYVISIFADLSTVAHLCKWKENIHLVNILCIVHMKALLTRLRDNCENGEFDFLYDKVLVQLMLDTSKTELLKEQNQLQMEDEKINHEAL